MVEAMVPRAGARQGQRAARPRRTVPRQVVRFGLDAPQRAGRLRPRGRRTAWPGWCARWPTDDAHVKRAQGRRRRGAPPAAPDAGRRAAHARPPQRRQRAGRAGAGHRHRLPAGADAARPARVPRRAAPRRVRRAASTASRPSTTARAPTSAPPWPRSTGLGADKAPGKLVVILGGDGKGQDFAPLAAPVARHARAVALIGRDAAAIEAALAGTRRADAAPRHARSRHRLVLRAGARRRRGAAEPGLRQPGHVPQLRATAPRSSSPRCRRWRPSRRGVGCDRRAAADALHGLAAAARCAQRRAARDADALPVRDWVGADAGAAAARAARLRPGAGAGSCWRCWRSGLVMVYSASVALPDNPQVRALRAHALPDAPRAVAGHRLRRWRWLARAGAGGVLGEVRAAAVFVVVAGAAGAGAGAVHRQGRQRRAALDPAGRHELPAQRAGQARRSRCTPPATWCARWTRARTSSGRARRWRSRWRFVGLLLLAEPDMGAFMVIAAIAMGILFLGGVNGRMFFADRGGAGRAPSC